MQHKFLIVSTVAIAVLGVVPFLPTGIEASILRTAGVHNERTMADADKKASDAKDAVVEASKDALESGKNVVQATEALADPQAGNTDAQLGNVDRATAAYLASIEKVRGTCETYASRLDTLQDEFVAEDERWTEIISAIKDPKMKADQQNRKIRRMNALRHKLQSGNSALRSIYAGLNRANDVKLALASVREDARVEAIETKVAGVVAEVRDANKGLEHALVAISASLDTGDVDAGTESVAAAATAGS